MSTVDHVDDVVARLRGHGAELVGEMRGPEGIIIGLAEQLS